VVAATFACSFCGSSTLATANLKVCPGFAFLELMLSIGVIFAVAQSGSTGGVLGTLDAWGAVMRYEDPGAADADGLGAGATGVGALAGA
jgi:hypothetical protein